MFKNRIHYNFEKRCYFAIRRRTKNVNVKFILLNYFEKVFRNRDKIL